MTQKGHNPNYNSTRINPKNQLLDLKSLVSNRRSNSEPVAKKNGVKLPLDPKNPWKNEGFWTLRIWTESLTPLFWKVQSLILKENHLPAPASSTRDLLIILNGGHFSPLFKGPAKKHPKRSQPEEPAARILGS